ncbi:hypothetical protein OESDEN_11546 [Oesophagostomum dentatum]|uniref:non-specific serine/threonine protein kinase n=1 Tax=Oesophagostomum dentatum TaxID=61180 RepID=A0A0B1SYV3_OESDE|nr:hypothetical protein OESDEN_11546 [Oesophagostomum dentatum]
MAPEILNNSPTTAADVYSLGVSMLELATNVDLRERSHRIRNGELDDDLFEGVSEDLRQMITSLLCPDPLQRPSTSQLLCDACILRNIKKPVVFRHLEVVKPLHWKKSL